MYVIEAGEGTFASPTARIHKTIGSSAEISALRHTGVLTVCIDPERGQASGHTGKSIVGREFLETVADVSEKMTRAVAYSRSMMEDVRLGRAVNPAEASKVVDYMLASVFKNQPAALFLTKLGNYDDYTYMHCVNVSVLASVFGKHLGLPNTVVHDLGLSGLLHDLGKALIPDTILNKPGKLTPDELAVMRSHPLKGHSMLKDVPGIVSDVLQGALQHHEKWDGTGYPAGLRGESINEFARILAVVDVYDAMTSNRVYHKKRAETDVLGYLFQQKEAFAPSYVELFVKAVGIYPPGTLVRLSDDVLAVVCAVNPDNTMTPLVAVVDEQTMKATDQCIDLADKGAEVKIVEVLDQGRGSVDLSALLG